ncbi:uncharacterized protein SETTUDRAFT_166708 [Exserohilum turcica Et28A]|uniref:Uncharacterized protein n=3 Tax=Pleosporaceae TaxID=28556 RepID=R0J255_EXST2|nr:uncharacterized protein SETTUDRAFT_166708 [Exserohilum turcica Et28A]EOA90846.1 hypothetical protein SETTUDRAFT_166708 [Exserohilum turcica Et28A]
MALKITVLMYHVKLGPLHLRMRLQRRRFGSNARLNPLAEVQASIPGPPRSILACILPVASYSLPTNRDWSSLLLGLGTGADGLMEQWGGGGPDQVFRSVSEEDNSRHRSLRAS